MRIRLRRKAWGETKPILPCTVEKSVNFYILSLTYCAISSVGRAARLHREGREFKSLIAH